MNFINEKLKEKLLLFQNIDNEYGKYNKTLNKK